MSQTHQRIFDTRFIHFLVAIGITLISIYWEWMYFVVFLNELCNLKAICEILLFVVFFQEYTFCIHIFMIFLNVLKFIYACSVDTDIGQLEWWKRPLTRISQIQVISERKQ